ncbi:MAG TPA: hypothetical protein VIH90_05785 [Candidatus Saccharimonadales bacterium]
MIKRLLIIFTSLLVLGIVLRLGDVSTNLVRNPNIKNSSSISNPNNWKNGKWGNNITIFSYLAEVRNNPGSLRVQLKNYHSGDAKWYFEPIKIKAGEVINYSDSYKSFDPGEVVASLTTTSGEQSYLFLATVRSTHNQWKNFSYNFVVPNGTIRLTIFHSIYREGILQTKDFSLRYVAVCNKHILSTCYNGTWNPTNTHLSIYKLLYIKPNIANRS